MGLNRTFLRLVSCSFVFLLLSFSADAQNRLEQMASSEYPDSGCFLINESKEVVIRDEATFQLLLRDRGIRDDCRKKLPPVDFRKEILAGIRLNTGHCRRPLLLSSTVFFDSETKRYNIGITYEEPREVCRALSRYDLWLRIPRVTGEFEVGFDVFAVSRNPISSY